MEIKLIVEDEDGDEIDSFVHFDLMKEARLFVKEALLTPDYWDRRSEVEGYHKQVYTIQLLRRKNMWDNWECVQDWFPAFFKSSKTNEIDA